MQVLQDLRDDLTLRAGVLLSHGSVYQLRDVLIEVRDEMLKILFVRFRVQAFTSDPFDGVPLTVSNKLSAIEFHVGH